MRRGHLLKRALFTRKMVPFWPWKWLFYEGFTKMYFFWVWNPLFETLGRRLKTEVDWGLFWKVFGRSFERDLGLPWWESLSNSQEPRSLGRRTAFTSWQFLPSLVPRSSSRGDWPPHSIPPSPEGLFSWDEWPVPFQVGLFILILDAFYLNWWPNSFPRWVL